MLKKFHGYGNSTLFKDDLDNEFSLKNEISSNNSSPSLSNNSFNNISEKIQNNTLYPTLAVKNDSINEQYKNDNRINLTNSFNSLNSTNKKNKTQEIKRSFINETVNLTNNTEKKFIVEDESDTASSLFDYATKIKNSYNSTPVHNNKKKEDSKNDTLSNEYMQPDTSLEDSLFEEIKNKTRDLNLLKKINVQKNEKDNQTTGADPNQIINKAQKQENNKEKKLINRKTANKKVENNENSTSNISISNKQSDNNSVLAKMDYNETQIDKMPTKNLKVKETKPHLNNEKVENNQINQNHKIKSEKMNDKSNIKSLESKKQKKEEKNKKQTLIYNTQEDQYLHMLENERKQYILYEKILTISFSLVIIGCIMIMLLGLVFLTYMNTNKN